MGSPGGKGRSEGTKPILFPRPACLSSAGESPAGPGKLGKGQWTELVISSCGHGEQKESTGIGVPLVSQPFLLGAKFSACNPCGGGVLSWWRIRCLEKAPLPWPRGRMRGAFPRAKDLLAEKGLQGRKESTHAQPVRQRETVVHSRQGQAKELVDRMAQLLDTVHHFPVFLRRTQDHSSRPTLWSGRTASPNWDKLGIRQPFPLGPSGALSERPSLAVCLCPEDLLPSWSSEEASKAWRTGLL